MHFKNCQKPKPLATIFLNIRAETLHSLHLVNLDECNQHNSNITLAISTKLNESNLSCCAQILLFCKGLLGLEQFQKFRLSHMHQQIICIVAIWISYYLYKQASSHLDFFNFRKNPFLICSQIMETYKVQSRRQCNYYVQYFQDNYH